MKKWFYEKNEQLIDDHSVNKTFEEILWMSDEEFVDWMRHMRKTVVKLWDDPDLNLPPRVGFSEREIIKQFENIEGFKVQEFLVEDLDTKQKDVIRNTSVVGNACNQWFPTMMKTKIAYSKNEGLSIYDHFKEEKLFEKTVTYARRHFKRDSFYHYSNPVRSLDPATPKSDLGTNLFAAQSATQWIKTFEDKAEYYRRTHDYWLEQKDDEQQEYTGYNEELKNVQWLRLSKEEFDEIKDIIPKHCTTNLNWEKSNTCQVRAFKKGTRIFPLGLKAFRISWCQYAVNFPPLTAKFLYEKYTEHVKDEPIIIWDPSAGWGGRLLGAMGYKDTKNVLYLGTDPNTDHNTENGRTKYHELADFYNTKTSRSNPLHDKGINDYKIFQCGSEEMSHRPDFQEYKGKVGIVFTSPPYFCKEIYSADETQSCNKFKGYDEWKTGFLYPTLRTAVEWLANDRYLLWNIADIKLGKDMLPLEKDSCDYLESLGMIFKHKLKMSLAQMPGGNRVDHDTGEAMAKNTCRIKEAGKKGKPIILKYEPIFIFYKP